MRKTNVSFLTEFWLGRGDTLLWDLGRLDVGLVLVGLAVRLRGGVLLLIATFRAGDFGQRLADGGHVLSDAAHEVATGEQCAGQDKEDGFHNLWRSFPEWLRVSDPRVHHPPDGCLAWIGRRGDLSRGDFVC